MRLVKLFAGFFAVVAVIICLTFVGAYTWFYYLLPWIKARRVEIRGKDGRR
jgi:hypothetical protein